MDQTWPGVNGYGTTRQMWRTLAARWWGEGVAFKDKLRRLRSASGESLQQVADAIGVSKAHIWELETGRSGNPSLEMLQKLAGHFRVTIAYLAEEVPEGEAKATHFFRKNQRTIQAMSDADLSYIESLMSRLAGKGNG
jgi:transcriptional regulator with XRE-family HTH domain